MCLFLCVCDWNCGCVCFCVFLSGIVDVFVFVCL